MRAVWIIGSLLAVAAAHSAPSLKQAAVLYHQGRYDSALAVLESCRGGALRHRDSLSLFQYSGMASARLGKDEDARSDFRALLDLDSLFQFPRNEDSAILSAFGRARMERYGTLPGSGDTASDRNLPTRLAEGETGAGTALPVGITAPDKQVPTTPSGNALPAAPAPIQAFTANPGSNGPPGIGLAMGAIPLGGGWLMRGRRKQGLTLAFLQAGGIALSLYASSQITAIEGDADGIRDHGERGTALRWQWTQGVTLSLALGSYLFSLIASKGD